MGLSFYSKSRQSRHTAQTWVERGQWAWCINGCASVIGAILATLLAIEFGFAALVMMAVTLYLTTPLTLRMNEPAQ